MLLKCFIWQVPFEWSCSIFGCFWEFPQDLRYALLFPGEFSTGKDLLVFPLCWQHATCKYNRFYKLSPNVDCRGNGHAKMVPKWLYEHLYRICGILLLKLFGYSVQIYSLQCFSHLHHSRYLSAKARNTNVCVCGIPGLYRSKYHSGNIGFVQWLEGFEVKLVLCQKQEALG